jgi:hypothetical protein
MVAVIHIYEAVLFNSAKIADQGRQFYIPTY